MDNQFKIPRGMHAKKRIIVTLKDGTQIPVTITESPLILLEHQQNREKSRKRKSEPAPAIAA